MTEVRQEILISRIIDGDANTAEWDELTAMAERDPRLWRTVVESIRDHQAFTRGMHAAARAADRIDALSTSAHDTRGVIARIGSWSGWGVAAVVALVWVIGLGVVPAEAEPLTPEEHFQQYVELGQASGNVLQEMPEPFVLQIRSGDDGSPKEVIFARVIVERVTNIGGRMYLTEQDAEGQNVVSPFDNTALVGLRRRIVQID